MIFILIIFFEIFSIIFCQTFNVCRNPSYSFTTEKPTHFLDINKNFGTWHEANSKFRHKSECFDVEYKFNSYGAKDIQRKKKDKYERTILIGDSFVEGYGLSNNNTISKNLETLSGKDYLNFGTSGHFGTTQYRLLYEHLASDFNHNTVLVFLTVTNDFEDDSFEFGKNYHKNRFRPYLVRRNNKFELIYFDKEKYNFKNISEKNIFIKFLNNYTYSYNLLRLFYQKFRYVLEVRRYEQSLKKINELPENTLDVKANINYYENYSKESFEILEYNIKNINELAKSKKINFWLISTGFINEVNIILKKKGNIKLINDLKKISKKYNFNYFDLTTELVNNFYGRYEDLFFECDNHYNKFGNSIISEIILKKIN